MIKIITLGAALVAANVAYGQPKIEGEVPLPPPQPDFDSDGPHVITPLYREPDTGPDTREALIQGCKRWRKAHHLKGGCGE